MEGRRRIGGVLILAVAWLVSISSAQADSTDVTYLQVSQAYASLPRVLVYLNVRDADDHPVSALWDSQVEANVGGDPVPVRSVAPFDSTAAGIAYIFLVDVSRSLPDREFSRMRAAMNEWVGAMGPEDRAAVITFGETVRLVADFTVEKDTLRAMIDGLRLTDLQTRLHDALVRALEMGRRADPELPFRRVIITLSDGDDDFPGGTTREEVLERMRVDPVPLYAIAFRPGSRTARTEAGLRALGEFARATGGALAQAGSAPLDEIYDALLHRIRAVHVAELDCSACPSDGRIYRLQMTVTDGVRRLTDGLDVRLIGMASVPTADAPASAGVSRLWIPGVAVLLLLALVGLVYLRRRSNQGAPPSAGGEAGASKPVHPPAPPDREEAPQEAEMPVADAQPPLELTFTPVGVRATEVPRTSALRTRLVLGRNAGSVDVAFADHEVSSEHCELIRADGRVLIRDLGSTNGTYVNGVPVRGEFRVESGDVIGLGGVELRVSIDEGRA